MDGFSQRMAQIKSKYAGKNRMNYKGNPKKLLPNPRNLPSGLG
jgi:hypothetical protein